MKSQEDFAFDIAGSLGSSSSLDVLFFTGSFRGRPHTPILAGQTTRLIQNNELGVYSALVFVRDVVEPVSLIVSIVPRSSIVDDSLFNGEERIGSVPRLGDLTIPFDVNSSGTVLVNFGAVNGQPVDLDIAIISPTGERIVSDSISENSPVELIEFDAAETGQYSLLIENDDLEVAYDYKLRAIALSSPVNLIDGLDNPIQNGQEITATIPQGGIAIIPLDIDLSEPGFGELQVSGTANGFIPFHHWFKFMTVKATFGQKMTNSLLSILSLALSFLCLQEMTGQLLR